MVSLCQGEGARADRVLAGVAAAYVGPAGVVAQVARRPVVRDALVRRDDVVVEAAGVVVRDQEEGPPLAGKGVILLLRMVTR
jgi:hypothetical protein